MTSYRQDLNSPPPPEEMAISAYISLAAILVFLCSIGLYAYPRDHQMIVTATNAIGEVDAIMQGQNGPR